MLLTVKIASPKPATVVKVDIAPDATVKQFCEAILVAHGCAPENFGNVLRQAVIAGGKQLKDMDATLESQGITESTSVACLITYKSGTSPTENAATPATPAVPAATPAAAPAAPVAAPAATPAPVAAPAAPVARPAVSAVPMASTPAVAPTTTAAAAAAPAGGAAPETPAELMQRTEEVLAALAIADPAMHARVVANPLMQMQFMQVVSTLMFGMEGLRGRMGDRERVPGVRVENDVIIAEMTNDDNNNVDTITNVTMCDPELAKRFYITAGRNVDLAMNMAADMPEQIVNDISSKQFEFRDVTDYSS